LKLIPGLGTTFGLYAMFPGADAPDQITTLSDHCLLDRDEGIWHGFTAVVLKVSGSWW
jgi:hypothetical protein